MLACLAPAPARVSASYLSSSHRGLERCAGQDEAASSVVFFRAAFTRHTSPQGAPALHHPSSPPSWIRKWLKVEGGSARWCREKQPPHHATVEAAVDELLALGVLMKLIFFSS